MRMILYLFIFFFAVSTVQAQQRRTENLVIVTLDGFRWQELFTGADSAILFNKDYTADTSLQDRFWATSAAQRREALLPFFWSTLGTQGQLYGNRYQGNKVNCANPFWFSYPGYSELFTGMVDLRVRSNNKIENPNPSVLEFIHSQPEYEGRVAAFHTWDVIPYVIRADRAAIATACGKITKDSCGQQITLPKNTHRYDSNTFQYAFDYIQKKSPKVVFISFDGTDDFAHRGKYDQYLKAAHDTDARMAQLWNWLQTHAPYKDRTTLLITTDHGRGKGPNSWKGHGRLAFGSGQIWFALIGPDTPAQGEIKTESQLFQRQFAKTAARFLGLEFENTEPVGEAIHTMMVPDQFTARQP